MKLRTLLSTLSVALNAMLATLLVSGFSDREEDAIPPAATSGAPSRTVGGKIDPTVWPSLRTPDLPVLVARLRAAGFPPEMLRVVVSEQLREATAVEREPASGPFWKDFLIDLRPRPALHVRSVAADAHISELVVPQPAEDYDPRKDLLEQRLLNSVPPEKREQVMRLFHDVDEKQEALLEESSRTPNREKNEAIHREIAALDRACLTALAQMLTPAEFAEYELRMSETAGSMREDLAAFHPTEAEFRRLFPLQRAFDEEFNEKMRAEPFSLEEKPEYVAAQRRLLEQIKAALGPVRGEEYVLATDEDYKNTRKLTGRLGLSPEAAVAAWRVQQELQQRLTAIKSDSSLVAEERAQQIAQLATDAKAKIAGVLGGDSGFQAYEEYYTGRWLRALRPEAKKTPPVTR